MNVLIKLPLTGYRPGSSANIANYVLYLLQIFFSKQWLWFSCLSGRFQHERSTVRIQSMAKIYPEQECSLNCWKGENKEREREAYLIYNNPPGISTSTSGTIVTLLSDVDSSVDLTCRWLCTFWLDATTQPPGIVELWLVSWSSKFLNRLSYKIGCRVI